MSKLARELLQLKEKLENMKQQKSILESKVSEEYENLKTQFDCKTLAAAKKELKELKDNNENLRKKLEGQIDDIRKKL